MRELRQKASADARLSRELAGLDVKRAEEEFLEFARSSEADNEFDALIGLTTADEAPAAEQETKTTIPEE